MKVKFSYPRALVIKILRIIPSTKEVPAAVPALFNGGLPNVLAKQEFDRSRPKEHVLVVLACTRALASCNYPGEVHACTGKEHAAHLARA